jgi:hypothetical protein
MRVINHRPWLRKFYRFLIFSWSFGFGFHFLGSIKLMTFFHLFFIPIIICGVMVHPFLFGILLLYVIITSNVLTNVLKALRMPWIEIMWTFFLLISIIYGFSLISYQFFSVDYPNDTCYSLLTCLMVNIDLTFKADGGLGGMLNQPYIQDDPSVS